MMQRQHFGRRATPGHPTSTRTLSQKRGLVPTLALGMSLLLLLGACQDKSKKSQTSDPSAHKPSVLNSQSESGQQAPSSSKDATASATKKGKGGHGHSKAEPGKDSGHPGQAKPTRELHLPEMEADSLLRGEIRHQMPQGKFRIAYPAALQAKFGEAVELDKAPERLVDLSTSSLYLLSRLDIKPIAVSSSVGGTRAREVYKDLPRIQAGMNTIDTEAVVALKPDLVMLSAYHAEKFGKQLESLGIPTYYTSEGPAVDLAANRAESLALAEAFGGAEALADVTRIYDELDAKIADYKKQNPGHKAMVLFGMDQSHVASSRSFFGGLVKALGFENPQDEQDGPGVGLTPINMEFLMTAQPEWLFLIAPPTGYQPEELKAAFDALTQKDAGLWTSLQAVKDGHILAFASEYSTSRGLEVVDSVERMIKRLQAELH